MPTLKPRTKNKERKDIWTPDHAEFFQLCQLSSPAEAEEEIIGRDASAVSESSVEAGSAISQICCCELELLAETPITMFPVTFEDWGVPSGGTMIEEDVAGYDAFASPGVISIPIPPLTHDDGTSPASTDIVPIMNAKIITMIVTSRGKFRIDIK